MGHVQPRLQIIDHQQFLRSAAGNAHDLLQRPGVGLAFGTIAVPAIDQIRKRYTRRLIIPPDIFRKRMADHTDQTARILHLPDQLRHPGKERRDDTADMIPPDLPFPMHLGGREAQLFGIKFTESGGEVLRQKFFLCIKSSGTDLFQYLQKSGIVNTRRAVHRRIIMV